MRWLFRIVILALAYLGARSIWDRWGARLGELTPDGPVPAPGRGADRPTSA